MVGLVRVDLWVDHGRAHGGGSEVSNMTRLKRPSGRRFVAVAISCTALAAVSLGSAFAARSQPSGAVAGGAGQGDGPRMRLLAAEIGGAEAGELDELDGGIQADDQEVAEPPEVETPEPKDTPEAADTPEPPEVPETEPADAEQDDQGEDANDQGEDANHQGEDANDQGEHDSGDAAEHDDGGESGD